MPSTIPKENNNTTKKPTNSLEICKKIQGAKNLIHCISILSDETDNLPQGIYIIGRRKIVKWNMQKRI